MKKLLLFSAIILSNSVFSQTETIIYNECIESIGLNEKDVLVFVLLSSNEIDSKIIEEKDVKTYNESVKRYAEIYKGKYEILTSDELDKVTPESNYKYLFNVNLYLTYGRKLNIRGCGTMLLENGTYYSFKKIVGGNIANTVKEEIQGIENCRVTNTTKK
jgi:hypothetical protein